MCDFFGGPYDGEDHEVPSPHPPVLLVPYWILEPSSLGMPGPVPEVSYGTVEYCRFIDEDGSYYVIDDGPASP